MSAGRISDFGSHHTPSDSGIEGLPLISIVTVVFNGAKTLRATIESIVPQLREDVEYIIIDGGSSDGTIVSQRIDSVRRWASVNISLAARALNACPICIVTAAEYGSMCASRAWA